MHRLYSVDTRLEWMYEKAKEDPHISYGYSEGGIFPCDSAYNDDGAVRCCASGFIWGSEDNKDYTPELRQDQGNDLKFCENL